MGLFQLPDTTGEQLNRPEDLAAYALITEVLAAGQAVEAAPQAGFIPEQVTAARATEIDYWRGKKVPVTEKIAMRDMAEESRDEIRRVYPDAA
ncbi:MAG TPA: hypothetical protein VHB51_01895 [Candidatus Saccharimonadales bacterium]|nr:hypothetical protein [Candidatus Saccharimonadales bacterium]